MHRFSSRSAESADLSALRHARQRPPQTYSLQYVEEAGGTRLRVVQHRRCSTPDDVVTAVENLCIVQAIMEITVDQAL
ncbi:MAG: hypothetical protein V3T60_12710 [Candidatus Binatia bacterium]